MNRYDKGNIVIHHTSKSNEAVKCSFVYNGFVWSCDSYFERDVLKFLIIVCDVHPALITRAIPIVIKPKTLFRPIVYTPDFTIWSEPKKAFLHLEIKGKVYDDYPFRLKFLEYLKPNEFSLLRIITRKSVSISGLQTWTLQDLRYEISKNFPHNPNGVSNHVVC